MTQLGLFKDRIAEAFAKFDHDNPHVWHHYERFTLLAISSGRVRYSSDAIVHRIRWHLDIETRSADEFKINDHFTALYARKFHAEHPEHDGFFSTRVRRTE